MAENILNIPKANPLRWVRVDTFGIVAPTIDNLLYENEDWTNDTKVKQLQKFSNTNYEVPAGDTISTQFTTNYNTVKFELFTILDVKVGSDYTLTEVYAYDDKRVLQTEISCTSKGGIYYAKISASSPGKPRLEYQSEYFEVANYKTLPYFKWYNSQTDGIIYDGTQIFGCRLEAKIDETKVGINSKVYENYNFSSITLRANPIRSIIVSSIPIPRWQVEKLTVAIAHKDLYINGVLYRSKDEPKSEQILGSSLYDFSFNLFDAIYEDYQTLSSQSENPDEPIEESYLTYTDTITDIVTYTETSTDKILLY